MQKEATPVAKLKLKGKGEASTQAFEIKKMDVEMAMLREKLTEI